MLWCRRGRWPGVWTIGSNIHNAEPTTWTVRYEMSLSSSGYRAYVTLFELGKSIRRFNVKVQEGGVFSVDVGVGTGSGLKVKFRHQIQIITGAR